MALSAPTALAQPQGFPHLPGADDRKGSPGFAAGVGQRGEHRVTDSQPMQGAQASGPRVPEGRGGEPGASPRPPEQILVEANIPVSGAVPGGQAKSTSPRLPFTLSGMTSPKLGLLGQHLLILQNPA